jgi:hypothetical protein
MLSLYRDQLLAPAINISLASQAIHLLPIMSIAISRDDAYILLGCGPTCILLRNCTDPWSTRRLVRLPTPGPRPDLDTPATDLDPESDIKLSSEYHQQVVNFDINSKNFVVASIMRPAEELRIHVLPCVAGEQTQGTRQRVLHFPTVSIQGSHFRLYS